MFWVKCREYLVLVMCTLFSNVDYLLWSTVVRANDKHTLHITLGNKSTIQSEVTETERKPEDKRADLINNSPSIIATRRHTRSPSGK